MGTRLKLTCLLPVLEPGSAPLHSQARKAQLSRLMPATLGCCLQRKPSPRADWHCCLNGLGLNPVPFRAVRWAGRSCEPAHPSRGRDAVSLPPWRAMAGPGCWPVSLQASWSHSAARTDPTCIRTCMCVYTWLYTYPLYVDIGWHKHTHRPKEMRP